MSMDLGSDAGSASVNLMAKASEALLEAIKSLIKGLYTIYRDAPQHKQDVIKLREAKTNDEKIKILKKMQGVDGFVRAKKLEKYCDAIKAKVIPRNMEFDSLEQRNTFFAVAKEQHLLFSMTEDKSNPLKTTILVADKDMDLLKRCKELTDDTFKIKAIDEKIESIMGGRILDKLTEPEKFKIDLLNAEKASINAKWTNSFNQDAYKNILDSVLLNSHGEKKYEADKINFDYKTFTNDTFDKNNAFASALDSDVFKTLSKDRFSVVASTVDPNKYIICHSENNPDKNASKKIITSYEVFNGEKDENGKNVSKIYSDANLTVKEWIGMREEMQAFGGFGREDLMRFESVKDFENWRKFAEEQNANEEVRVYADSELKDALEKRTEELKTKGFEIREDGEVYSIADNKKSKDLVVELDNEIKNQSGLFKRGNEVEKNNLMKERAKMAEGVLIGLEISTYEQLSKVNNDLATVKTNLAIAEINKDAEKIVSIQNDIEELNNKHEILTSDKEKIVEQRKEINSVQADLDRKGVELEYRFSKEDVKTLKELGKSYEVNGFGKSQDFLDKINGMEHKEAVCYLAKLSVDIGKTCTERRNSGEDVADLEQFRMDLTEFQNKMLNKVKEVEPENFYKSNIALSGRSLDIAEKLATEYENMGLGTKEEFIKDIQSFYGNARLDKIENYKNEMLEKAEKVQTFSTDGVVHLEPNPELVRQFEDLSKLEFTKNEKAGEEFIASMGNADEDKSSDKEQNMEDWEKDINEKKENNNKESKENGTKEKETKEHKDKGDR